MIPESSIPKFNPIYRFQYEKAQKAWVLLYPEGMVKLNESAGEILSLVDGESSLADIVQKLSQKFPDADTIAEDVADFLEDARSRNWISIENS